MSAAALARSVPHDPDLIEFLTSSTMNAIFDYSVVGLQRRRNRRGTAVRV
jgi:hypothetical protein